MLKDGDYNPDQLRPVVEGKWRETEVTQSITIRGLLEKRIGAEAMKGSASLLSRGASRAARARIG
jgi:hypothetical protein